MLGDYEGLSPLQDRDRAIKIALPVMARLKAGKDVPTRMALLQRAVAAIPEGDRYWIETLASNLSGEKGLQAFEAELVSFAVAWAMSEPEISKLFRDVNRSGGDEYSGRVVKTLVSASPTLGARLKKNQVDSDEIFIRAALAHLFRHDPASAFQIFVVDAVARNIPKAMKTSIGALVKSAIERFDEEDVPKDAWGFCMILRDLTQKSGFFLYPPTDAARQTLARMLSDLKGLLPEANEDELSAHLVAAACSGLLFMGRRGEFAALMPAIYERLGLRYAVIYASEKEDETGAGTKTRVIEIPASSVDEARRRASRLPQVLMHDDFRGLEEKIRQMRDEDAERAKAH